MRETQQQEKTNRKSYAAYRMAKVTSAVGDLIKYYTWRNIECIRWDMFTHTNRKMYVKR